MVEASASQRAKGASRNVPQARKMRKTIAPDTDLLEDIEYQGNKRWLGKDMGSYGLLFLKTDVPELRPKPR